MEEEMIYTPHPIYESGVPSHFLVPNTLEKIHFWYCNTAEVRWAYRKLNAGGTIAETEGMLLRSGKFKNPNEPYVTGGGCNGSVYPHHYIKDAAGTLTKAGKMRKRNK